MLRVDAVAAAILAAAQRLCGLRAGVQLQPRQLNFDVGIVGAGPAGTSTALHLAALRETAGLRVVVFDRRRHPREKYCGGALSPWGVDVLSRLGLEHLVAGTRAHAVGLRVGARFGATPLDAGAGAVVVRRAVFDHGLVRVARDRGVDVREDCAVSSARRTATGWALATADGEHHVRVLVGADGAAGGSRRMLGLREPARHARLYLVETPGPERRDGVDAGTLLFDLGPTVEDGLEGYYWDFAAPLDGTPGTSRGIYHWNRRPLHDATQLKHSLARHLALRGVDLSQCTLKAHSIRPYTLGARASVPGGLLVGEAIGADPVTGEGIAHALAFGELAAEAIAHAFHTADFAFNEWNDRIASSFVGRHLRHGARLAPHVYGPRASLFARALAGSPSAMQIAGSWYAGHAIGRAARARVFAELARFAVRDYASGGH